MVSYSKTPKTLGFPGHTLMPLWPLWFLCGHFGGTVVLCGATMVHRGHYGSKIVFLGHTATLSLRTQSHASQAAKRGHLEGMWLLGVSHLEGARLLGAFELCRRTMSVRDGGSKGPPPADRQTRCTGSA